MKAINFNKVRRALSWLNMAGEGRCTLLRRVLHQNNNCLTGGVYKKRGSLNANKFHLLEMCVFVCACTAFG